MKKLETIDDVIYVLDEIIRDTEDKNDALGYFAVLYRRVTIKVKEGIKSGYFEDPQRMEHLDVLFAKRYIDAYFDYRAGKPISSSWSKAFELSHRFWPITLQHLLIGMNAHINLDLGIVAAEICKDRNIEELRNDFYKINKILSSLVHEVQMNLATIWPPLKHILLKTGQLDNLMVDFSMEIARDGAWDFACELAAKQENDIPGCINTRDEAVARVADIITNNPLSVKILLGIVRIGEIGSVSGKIRSLKKANPEEGLKMIAGIT